MKKSFLLTSSLLLIMIFTTMTKAQTTQTKLNQLELVKQLEGSFQKIISKDSIELWEAKVYGKAMIINVSMVIKGKKSLQYINNIGFSSKEEKLIGFVLWGNGVYNTWIGSFSSAKDFGGHMVNNLNPEKPSSKFDFVFNSPTEWILTFHDMQGVKTSEGKFVKVK